MLEVALFQKMTRISAYEIAANYKIMLKLSTFLTFF